MTSFVTNIHPAQYEIPQQSMNTAFPTVYTNTSAKTESEKKIGEKINQAFFLTIAFLVLSNSYKFFDNMNYMFTQRNFDFVMEQTGSPTTKGYVIISILFFLVALWILYRK